MKKKLSERFREWREERERRRAEYERSMVFDTSTFENEPFQKMLLEDGIMTQEEIEFAIVMERMEKERKAEVGDACLCSICPVECPRAMGWETDSGGEVWSCCGEYHDGSDRRR